MSAINPRVHHNEAGFSLIEVMVAAAIVGVSVVAYSQISNNAVRASQGQILDTDFNLLTSNVNLVLSSDCAQMLPGATYGLNPSPLATFSNVAITQPSASPSILAVVGYPLVGTRLTSLQISQVITPDLQPAMGNLHQSLVTFNVQAAKYISPSSGPGGFVGNNFFSKDFNTVIWYNDSTNQIIDCQRPPQPIYLNFGFDPYHPLSCYQQGAQLTFWYDTSSYAEGIGYSGTGIPLVSSNPSPSPLPNPSVSPYYTGSVSITIPTAGTAATFTATAFGNASQQVPVPVNFTAQSAAACALISGDCGTPAAIASFSISPNINVTPGQTLYANWSANGGASPSVIGYTINNYNPYASPTPFSTLNGSSTGVNVPFPAPSQITTYELIPQNGCGYGPPAFITVAPSTNCACEIPPASCTPGALYADSCQNAGACACPSQICPSPTPTCSTGTLSCIYGNWQCVGS